MTRALASSISALALLASAPASASTFMELDFLDLVDMSPEVVHVRVVNVQSAWTDSDSPVIASWAEIEVIANINGTLRTGQRHFVRELGGEVDGYVVQAVGFPHFEPGDEVVMFLDRWQDLSGDWRVSGYAQGIYEVTREYGAARVIPAIVQGDVPWSREVTIDTVIEPLTTLADLAQSIRAAR